MGAYLSKPITEKVSSDEYNENLKCGASSMQGWRVYQEDAHNVILNFDTNTSLFAVYDGHGGHEVATYTAQELPNFIKKTESFSPGQFSQALRDAFLEFDATLVEPHVLTILKDIAKMKDQDDSDYDGEEVDHLCREAAMPLEEVMAKYSEESCQLSSPNLTHFKTVSSSSSEGCYSKNLLDGSVEDKKQADETTDSSCSDKDMRSNLFSEASVKTSDESITPSFPSLAHPKSDPASGEEESSSSLCNGVPSAKSDDGDSAHSGSLNGECGISTQMNGNIIDSTASVNSPVKTPSKSSPKTPQSEDNEETIVEDACTQDSEKEGNISDLKMEEAEVRNTTIEDTKTEDSKSVVRQKKEVNGDLSSGKGKGGKGKCKGKGIITNAIFQAMKAVHRSEMRRKAAEKAEHIYRQIQDGDDDEDPQEEDDEDEDEEDDNFDDEECDNMDGDNSSSEDEDDDSDNKEDEADNEQDSEDNQYHEFSMSVREEPGYDSGCTACVALINGSELYVANVGDSRCVVCRNGQALDMSIDHKPEDEPEVSRIIKAGGRITTDGRVNGGLNLSRALGDHSYKQNKNQPPEEQMISPLPDVRSVTLTPEDSFMVIACDGIWNSMSSQDVCNFVAERITSCTNLSTIAEQMFNHCLSPDAHGDGTGCDNMTCIIVKFEGLGVAAESGKRACEAGTEGTELNPQEKKPRIEAQ